MTLSDFASHLDHPKPFRYQGCSGYRAKCPAHEDTVPSFAAWEGVDGWIHVRCQKGCSEEAIQSAMGIEFTDRKIDAYGSNESPDISYVYVDADGAYLFEKIRTVKGGKKSFLQRVKDGSQYKYSLSGLGDSRKTLYRLPEVKDAISKSKRIYLCEGEKAVDRIRKSGGVATCQPGGADATGSKWDSRMHTAELRGAKVTIVADRDEVGEAYASYVAGQLKGIAMDVDIVQSATIGAKDDAYDHLEAGHTLTDFVKRPDLMPKRGLKRHAIEDFERAEPVYLVGSHVRKGQINLLDADGGTGKTTLSLALAASGSLGYDPINRSSIEPFRTLYLGSEDDAGELRSVYEDLGGASGFLEVCDDTFSLDTHGLRQLKETILDGRFDLVIFDALIYYLSGIVKDPNNMIQVSPVLKAQRDVAMSTGAAILNLRHTAKGRLGKTPAELGLGSAAFRNSHRSQLVMRWHPDYEHNPGVRIVTHEKGSIRTPQAPAFGFEQKGANFFWRNDVDPSVFDDGGAFKPKKNALQEAEDFLIRELTGRYIPTTELTAMAEAMCISQRTLEQARAKLGVRWFKTGPNSHVVLHLPAPAGFSLEDDGDEF